MILMLKFIIKMSDLLLAFLPTKPVPTKVADLAWKFSGSLSVIGSLTTMYLEYLYVLCKICSDRVWFKVKFSLRPVQLSFP